MAEAVPHGPHMLVLEVTPVFLPRRPADFAVGGDGRNHHFHLRSNGFVWREVIVIHQEFRTLTAGHSGLELRVMLVLLGVQMHVATGDVDAQLGPLHLLGLGSGCLLLVDAGGSGLFVVGLVWNAASVWVLCVLMHCWSEAVL